MQLTPRQAELADAALRIVTREGMAAVSFRSVAAESGWSVGAVQKAYASKGEMVHAMFARLRALAAAPATSEPGRPTLHAWLTELFLGIMPLDDERRGLTLQGAAFAERAAYDAVVGTAIAASDTEIRGLVAQLVRRAQAEGEVPAALDGEAVAWAYLALAQGAATQLLYADEPETRVRALAEHAIRALLTPTEPSP